MAKAYHECAGHGPRHGGGMEAIVHEALGNVFFHNAVLLEGTNVNDEFVGNESILALKGNVKVGLQAFGHVVGIEDGGLSSAPQAFSAQHADVHPRDGQDERGAVGSTRHLDVVLGAGVVAITANGHNSVTREERSQM